MLDLNEWPKNPEGALAPYWRSADIESCCYLIWIARVIYLLSRDVTRRSELIFREKLRELLRNRSANKHEELLTELEVAQSFTSVISPISLEPLVPEEELRSSSKPVSMDFGLRLPEGDLGLEVTVWHWQMLRDFDAVAQQLGIRFQARLRKLGLLRVVQVRMPLGVSNSDIGAFLIPEVLDCMRLPAGVKHIETSAGRAEIEWWQEGAAPSIMPRERVKVPGQAENSTLKGVQIRAFSAEPIFGNDATELATQSLRRALDRKQRQARAEMPNIVAIGLGHRWLDWSWVAPIFDKRIWPNPKYKWISAIGAFVPYRDWTIANNGGRVVMYWNPSASRPVMPSVRDAADGKATFHAPGRKP